MPDIKVAGSFKEYYKLLNKSLRYLHDIIQNFKSKRLMLIKIECSSNIMVET